MSIINLRPNATISGLSDIAGGAGSRHAALNDDSDATYLYNLLIDNFNLDNPTFPANGVMRAFRFWFRAREESGFSADAKVEWSLNGTYVPATHSHYISNLTTTMTTYTDDWEYVTYTQQQMRDAAIYCNASSSFRFAEAGVDLMIAEQPGSPTVSSPTGTVSNTDRPTIDWAFNAGANGPGQAKYHVKIFSDAVYNGGGFDPETSTPVANSGKTTSSTTQWTCNTDLPNEDTYRAYVRTWASVNGTEQADAGWAYTQFTVNVSQTTPTNVVPADSATVTSSTPAIGADTTAMSGGITHVREWQVASDSGFTTDLQTHKETSYSTTKSGSISFPGAWSRLAQGTWYIRARIEDDDGNAGPWSSTNTFTVAHAPTGTTVSPVAGVSIQYDAVNDDVDLTWAFSDPDTLDPDAQTAYEVELWKLSAPGSPLTSGKVTSAALTHTMTGLDNTWKDTELRWRVRVYDKDDVVSAWSTDTSFFLRDLATINITAPVGVGGATNSQPTVTWTFSAAGGRTQKSYRVQVINTDDNDTVVADSGVVQSTDLSWQVPTPVIVISTNYQIILDIVDSSDLAVQDIDTFTASYSLPTTPTYTVTAATFEDDHAVLVDWSAATQDGTCLGWRVYRRLTGETTWVLWYDTDDPAANSFIDYTVPANLDVDFAVVQVAESLGDPVESAYPVQVHQFSSTNYFLTAPDNPALNVKLYNVVADAFADEQEMGELNVLNRGRQVEYGTRYGQRGSLTSQIFDQTDATAREQRIAIEGLRDSQLLVYLKTPFGDVWPIAMPSARITRISGMGLHEAATAQIDYLEVSA